ncbi:MAG TPA: CoA transferase [candidate division Zixibacteria bacterium]|nr:CoA transferase [candidate division Zixibacteria bacterium]
MAAEAKEGALDHLRVVEIGDLPAAYATRLLGDLGADVVKVEPPGGDPSRRLPPFAGGIEHPERSLAFINANTNKRSIVLDPAGAARDRELLELLLASAHVFIEATPAGFLESFGLTDERLGEIAPALVTVSISPFGRTGPYRTYKGSDAIANASGGFLFGQGDDTKGQCTAPCHLAYQLAACVAAALALAGVRHARRSGAGQRIDVSLQEALTFTNSSSVARYSRENRLERRPGSRHYGGAGTNIYRCKDGRYVHFTTNMPHMWREFAQNWLGDPELARPEWESARHREAHAERVGRAFAEFIARFTAEEFCNEAQRRHLAAAPLNTVGEFVACEQLRARGWLQEIEHPVIGRYTAPGFPMRLSLTPMRIRRPAPLLDQHRAEIAGELEGRLSGRPPRAAHAEGARRPMLEGLRMADLTQQYAGPLGTEMLAYYGMEVIKIESAVVPSKDREAAVHADMNRCKLGCTINLRHPEGKELFRSLIARSDAVVDNFSAGVLERLGFGFEELQRINPGIVQAVMPGWGLEGPLRSWVAWGWQLLAYTGVMRLWGYPDSPMESRCKIAWPDRVAAATMMLGVLAALEYRDRTGRGQFVEAAMLEAQGAMLGPAVLDYTVNGREWEAAGYGEVLGEPYAPYGCYPCRGEDQWIIIACAGDREWQSMARLIGEPWAASEKLATHAGRKELRDELDRELSRWTRRLTPRQAFRLLQEAGVAAGIPMSGEDLFYDIHLRARGHIVETEARPWGKIVHHGLPGIPSLSRADAARPAPWIGADNDYVFGVVLGLGHERIAELTEAGAIR